MFTRICTTAALLLANSLTALPAKAELLPTLFAYTFCDARKAGVTQLDSIKIAYRRADNNTVNTHTIIVDGQKFKSDEYMAMRKALDICPDLIGN